jgi:predicted O-methyltransferase YrrM
LSSKALTPRPFLGLGTQKLPWWSSRGSLMTLEPVDPEIRRYLDSLVPLRAPELAAMEAEAERTKFPIIGPAAGHFCYTVARLIEARAVFELGSGFGYSTAWFARAVRENGGGVVHHTVWDAALSTEARVRLAALGFADLVQYHIGEAVQTLHETRSLFDLVFLDIDKAGYPAALPVIHERLRPGGVLIADNLLWHGQVLDPKDKSEDTAGVREFTRLVTTGQDWLASVVPIRDGLLLAYRR